jgi:ribonuclease BN (tRNA processing enzyme)
VSLTAHHHPHQPLKETAMSTTRRHLLRGAAALPGAAVLAAATPAVASDLDVSAAEAERLGLTPRPLVDVPTTGTHLVLLGTGGGPVPFPGRVGICTAVVVDGFAYLVDLGHGAFDQLGKTTLDVARIPAAFITHLHSDHIADAWSIPFLRFGGRNPLGMPLHVYGPANAGGLSPQRSEGEVRLVNPASPTPGTEEFFAKMIEGSAYDLNVRMRDEAWPDIAEMLVPHDVAPPSSTGASFENVCPDMEPFEVMRDERVRVSATLVQHAPVYPSYAFRFDTRHGSITVSGDTARSENLIRLAHRTDLLVHEVIDTRLLQLDPTITPEQLAHLTEAHTPVTEVGRIASDAQAGTLVLSHLAPSSKAVPDAGWQKQAQRGFSGAVHVGNDVDVLSL